jgi:hypothetical protein
MTEAELDSLDHIDDEDYWDHALSDEGLVYGVPYIIKWTDDGLQSFRYRPT